MTRKPLPKIDVIGVDVAFNSARRSVSGQLGNSLFYLDSTTIEMKSDTFLVHSPLEMTAGKSISVKGAILFYFIMYI